MQTLYNYVDELQNALEQQLLSFLHQGNQRSEDLATSFIVKNTILRLYYQNVHVYI